MERRSNRHERRSDHQRDDHRNASHQNGHPQRRDTSSNDDREPSSNMRRGDVRQINWENDLYERQSI